MYRVRASIGLAGILLIAGMFAVVGTLERPNPAAAQGGDGNEQCVLLPDTAFADAEQTCGDLARGEVCLGYGSVSAANNGEAVIFTAGEPATINDVTALSTMGEDGGGIIMMQLPAGLPEQTPGVTGILFGRVSVGQPAAEVVERPTLPVSNPGSAPVNLRAGAGVNFPVIDSLEPGAAVVADGRNQQGDWLRLQTANGVAWAFVRVIDWEGDVNSLEVLAPDDIIPPFAASAPFERMILESEPLPACGTVSSGMLLRYSGEDAATLMIDGVRLEFADAALLVHAAANDSLHIVALSGAATVTAQGTAEDVSAGGSVTVGLGGEAGLTAATTPTVKPAVALTEVADLPSALLPEATACVVGVADPSQDVVLRVGPGENRGTLAAMNPNKSYVVIGQANAPDGSPWWQLDTGEQKSWVAQSAVRTLGNCAAVAAVEPPPLVFAPPSAPPAGSGDAADNVDDFSPAANSVWQMNPGSDNMSGECSGAPAINFCDHLAAISPASGGIMWKGMEASPYYLQRIQPNVYAYSGPNVLGTGTINMTLRFTSDGALTMTQSLTLTSEPNCVHTYYYSGTKNW